MSKRMVVVMLLVWVAKLVGAASLTWDANPSDATVTDGGGTWNSSNTNWWNGVANTNWTSADPDTATFGVGSGAAGTVTVSGAQTVGGITFNPPGSGTYTLSGGTLVLSNNPTITANAGAAIGSILAGSTGFTKAGSGVLTLSGTNTYAGATVINNGTLAIGTTVLALPGAVTVNASGVLSLNAGAVTYSNNLSGAGAVNVTTAGNTFLTGDLHLFTGTLDITGSSGGKLVYGTTSVTQGALISSSATIKVEAGNTLFGEQDVGANALNFGSGLQLYGAGNGENLGALRIDRSGAIWSGPITLFGNSSIGNNSSTGPIINGPIGQSGGSFGLTKLGNGGVTLAGTNTFSGATTISVGKLTLANGLTLTNSTVTVNVASGLAFSGATNFLFGGLAGNSGFALANTGGSAVTLAVGNNDVDSTYSGVLTGAGSLVKIGTGGLTLSGANTYTGPTIVSNGTLHVPPVTVVTNLPANLQIWPVGDSITYGSYGSNGGYRGQLYNLLAPIASGFLFVGSSVQNGGITTLPASEQHNEGHESYAIANIYTNVDGYDDSVYLEYGGASRNPNGGYWLTGIATGANARPALYPDITLLLIGANDRGNLAGSQSRLDSLVSKLVTLRPDMRLIVARITPITDSVGDSNFVTSYNHEVDAVVAKYAVSNDVTEVDLNTGFPPNALSADNLHPNDTGYNWMAGQWYAAILAVLGTVAPGTPTAAIPTNSPVTIMSGSTLDVGSYQQTVIKSLSGGGNVTLGAGANLTINNPAASLFSGAISGAGSLTKGGAGTLTLTGTNTYSGGTTVVGGELVVGPNFDAGSVTVATNAAFGITNSAAASALVLNLTVNAGATLEFFSVSSLTVPLLTAGSFQVNGACTVKITGTNGLAPGHAYPLINYGGGFSGVFSNLRLQIPAAWPCWLTSNSQQVLLSVAVLPAAPTNLTATAGIGQVSLNWTPADDATNFNVKRSTDNGATYGLVATNLTATTYTDAGLTAGATYYYVVSAVNAAGPGPDSAPVSARPYSLALTVTGASGQELGLTWDTDAPASLYYAPSLDSSALWMPVTNVPAVSNSQWWLTLPIGTNPSGFYRLQ